MTRIFGTAAALVCAFTLGGCAYNAGSADYRAYETQGEQTVRFGVVETVRPVRIQPANTGVGGTAGAFAGGIAGSTVGGGNGQIVGALAGTILGAIIGSNIEHQANEIPGVEVTVLLDSGQYIAVVQGADEPFRAGERVRIVSGRNATRVTH